MIEAKNLHKNEKHAHKVFKMACLCVVLALGISTLNTHTLRADIFLKPGQSEKANTATQKKSLWSKLWGNKAKSSQSNAIIAPDSAKNARKLTSAKPTYKQKSAIRYNGFEVYHAARGLDPDLLRMSSREPQTAEELMLVSAAHNTAKVAHALASRRKNRETLLAMRMNDEKLQLRRDLARAQAQRRQQTTQRRIISAKPTLHNDPEKNNPSSKVFTDFR